MKKFHGDYAGDARLHSQRIIHKIIWAESLLFPQRLAYNPRGFEIEACNPNPKPVASVWVLGFTSVTRYDSMHDRSKNTWVAVKEPRGSMYAIIGYLGFRY